MAGNPNHLVRPARHDCLTLRATSANFVHFQTFVGPPILKALPDSLHVLANLISGKVIGHQIGRILCAQNHGVFSPFSILVIPYPQSTDVDVP